MTSSPRDPIPYSDDVETIPADEAADIRDVIKAVQTILQRNHQQTGQRMSDVHAKDDGCARGEFRVLPNLPAELAQGLFGSERTFSAIVRFSNGAGQLQSD